MNLTNSEKETLASVTKLEEFPQYCIPTNLEVSKNSLCHLMKI